MVPDELRGQSVTRSDGPVTGLPLCMAEVTSGRQTLGVGSLLVITGPPGAGKSTVAKALAAAADPSVLVEGDTFFAFLANGRIDPWLAGSNDQNTIVTEAAAAAAGRFALGGYKTVYDGVVGPWFLATFAKATGLDVLEYLILLPSMERCVKQVAERTGHGFTDEAATRKMHKEFRRRSNRPTARPRRTMGFCRFGCRSGLSGPKSWRPQIPGKEI